jgi:hypothetical protein
MMEKPIGYGFGGFPLFKARQKEYRCLDCGGIFKTTTNHYEKIYVCYASPRRWTPCHGPAVCVENELETLARRMQDD